MRSIWGRGWRTLVQPPSSAVNVTWTQLEQLCCERGELVRNYKSTVHHLKEWLRDPRAVNCWHQRPPTLKPTLTGFTLRHAGVPALPQTALCLPICANLIKWFFWPAIKPSLFYLDWWGTSRTPVAPSPAPSPAPSTAPQRDQFTSQNPTEVLPRRLETISSTAP